MLGYSTTSQINELPFGPTKNQHYLNMAFFVDFTVNSKCKIFASSIGSYSRKSMESNPIAYMRPDHRSFNTSAQSSSLNVPDTSVNFHRFFCFLKHLFKSMVIIK